MASGLGTAFWENLLVHIQVLRSAGRGPRGVGEVVCGLAVVSAFSPQACVTDKKSGRQCLNITLSWFCCLSQAGVSHSPGSSLFRCRAAEFWLHSAWPPEWSSPGFLCASPNPGREGQCLLQQHLIISPCRTARNASAPSSAREARVPRVSHGAGTHSRNSMSEWTRPMQSDSPVAKQPRCVEQN